MKSLRELINLIDSKSTINESMPERKKAGKITVTSIDPTTGEITSKEVDPTFSKKVVFYLYKVPRDEAYNVVDGKPSARSLGLRPYSHTPTHYNMKSMNKRNPEAEERFGPGEEVIQTKKTGLKIGHLSPTLTPNTDHPLQKKVERERYRSNVPGGELDPDQLYHPFSPKE